MRTNKHPLRSGVPCRRYRCIKCCIETEMPLTRTDIKRILSLGYPLQYFVVKDGETLKLKNVNGRCVFLTEGGCKIYNHRPEGCRLYPLIYDENLNKPVLDDYCPHKNEFQPKKDDAEKLINLIKETDPAT